MKKATFIFLIIILTSSCEDTIDFNLQPENTNLLIVEGILTNQKINHRIKLTIPHQEINGDPEPATGAIVVIEEGNFNGNGDFQTLEVYNLTEDPSGSGEYFSEAFRAVFGRGYLLKIAYLGVPYFAFDASVPAEPLDSFDFELAGEDGQLFRLNLKDSGVEPNFINHEVSWENTPFCEVEELCKGKVVYYDLKTTDVSDLFNPDKTNFLFPVNSIVIRTKYSVNENFKNFLRSVLSETEWRGGLFDLQKANAPTNLSEGAIGYFAVSTVVSDTTIVN